MEKKSKGVAEEKQPTVREQLEAKTKAELVDIAEKQNNAILQFQEEIARANQAILKMAKA